MFSLDRFVEDVRVVPPGPIHRFPDGRTSLVLREMTDQTADLYVMGPRTRALFKHPTNIARCVVVEFKPGWATPLLGVAAGEVANGHAALEDVWGRPARILCEQLVATVTAPEILSVLSAAIAVRAQQTIESASARLARRAVRLLDGDEHRVDRVAQRLGVTARHLRRAFTEAIGIGPKDYVRSVRLQRALKLASTSRDWGRIATDAGYYDQAHLISDFRQLVGVTPGAYARRV